MAELDDTTQTTGVQATIQMEWDDVSAISVPIVNQFAVTVGLNPPEGAPDGLYLTLGHLSLPILTGPRDEVQAKLEASPLKIKVEGRFFLTRGRLDELIKILTSVADQYDQARRLATGGSDSESGS